MPNNALVVRMLAKSPEDRIQTPADLIAEIDRLVRGEAPPETFRPPTSRHGAPKSSRTSRRHLAKFRPPAGLNRGALMALGVGAALLVLGLLAILGRR